MYRSMYIYRSIHVYTELFPKNIIYQIGIRIEKSFLCGLALIVFCKYI